MDPYEAMQKLIERIHERLDALEAENAALRGAFEKACGEINKDLDQPGSDWRPYESLLFECIAKSATINELTKKVDRLVADGLEALSEEEMRRLFGDENVDAEARICAFVARHAVAKARDKATIAELRALLEEAERELMADPRGCPWCDGHDGHAPDCRLAVALADKEKGDE